MGHTPDTPRFNDLLLSLRTKQADGFLGSLPESWLEAVKPDTSGTPSTKAQETHTRVTNTSYVDSLKTRWTASGFMTIKSMRDAAPAGTVIPAPKVGGKEACLSWLLKGYCFADCPRKDTHKHAQGPLVAQAHTVLDACGVAPSN